ncbi:MAG TPA: hypothetical protein VFW68_15555 [Rhodocyclaceae bacterium]|nr:hypothetical protein [Rhodocyclaceae bacterium]
MREPGVGMRGRANAEWTQLPRILPVGMPKPEGVAFRPLGLSANGINIYGPKDITPAKVPVEQGSALVTPPGGMGGNYHWLIAREESSEEVTVASTAWYFSNPGASPKALLLRVRHELEIIPDPLPREHSQYREGERWRFLVRFQGKPLPGAKLQLETEAGTRTPLAADGDGVATVVLPRDLDPSAAQGGGHMSRGPRGGFVLAVRHEAEGRRYLTAFNANYGADPSRSQSLAWGAGFGVLGMALALPLVIRRKEKIDA